jgi:hypothetical protein
VKALGIYRPKVTEPPEILAPESDTETMLGHGAHGGTGAHHAPEVR